VAIIGGVTISIVFLLTKPPAVDMLPSQSFTLIGLFTPIVIFYYTLPRIVAVFSPEKTPEKPPEDQRGTEPGVSPHRSAPD
jgi:hypothetical protein